MAIDDEVDRILLELRARRPQTSLAGEREQDAHPDIDLPARRDADAIDARASGATGDDPIAARQPAVLDSAAEPAPAEPAGAWNDTAPSAPGGERAGGVTAEVVTAEVVTAEVVTAEVVTAEVASAAPGPAGELSTPAAPAAGPEATLAGTPTTSLDVHALARLEAAAGLAESLGLGFHLGGAVERIAVGASEGKTGVQALREASWLIERYILLVEQRPVGADLHATSVRLGRSGEAISGLRAISAALEAERAPDSAPPADREPSPASEPSPKQRSFGFEVALMAVRWSIMVASVIVIVLALTLISEWF